MNKLYKTIQETAGQLNETAALLNMLLEKAVLRGNREWDTARQNLERVKNELKRGILNWRTEPNKQKRANIRVTLKRKKEEVLQAMKHVKDVRNKLLAQAKAAAKSSNKGQRYHDFLTSRR